MRLAARLLVLLVGLQGMAAAQTGRELIEAGLQRYALPPHVYEEYALVMTDLHGQHTVRTARAYQQRDEQGSRWLLVIDTPAELRGTSLFVTRDAGNVVRHGASATSSIFGSNFSLADLEPEQPRDFDYAREEDQILDRVLHFVVRALPANATVARETGYQGRRIYLRKDNYFASRIDYLDREGRLARRQSFRDPRPDESGTWRAGMILMEDQRDKRRSLLKIDRRVHSADYVPASLFAGLTVEP